MWRQPSSASAPRSNGPRCKRKSSFCRGGRPHYPGAPTAVFLSGRAAMRSQVGCIRDLRLVRALTTWPRTSLAHPPDQRSVDLEGFVDLMDVAELVCLMTLSGLAGADDDRRDIVEAGNQCRGVSEVGCSNGIRTISQTLLQNAHQRLDGGVARCGCEAFEVCHDFDGSFLAANALDLGNQFAVIVRWHRTKIDGEAGGIGDGIDVLTTGDGGDGGGRVTQKGMGILEPQRFDPPYPFRHF